MEEITDDQKEELTKIKKILYRALDHIEIVESQDWSLDDCVAVLDAVPSLLGSALEDLKKKKPQNRPLF